MVVGEDAPNVSAAVAAAQPNTTVYLSPGIYGTDDLTIDKSITLAGAGNETILRGNDNRSIVHLRADRAAVRGLRIDGVGGVGSRRLEMRNGSENWATSVRLAYGYGDAGVVLDGSNGSVVSNVTIETNASGIIARESDRSVIDNVTVYGAATSDEGFMGATLIGARRVVQDSTFVGGRDGVYTHRADGSVIRRNRLEGGRYGTHEMYTSHTLVANNVARGVDGGVLVPTLTADQPTFLAQNCAVDSALRFVRFVVLSAGFTLVALAVTLAVSAAARTLRTAFVLATALTVAFVVGVDTTLIAGLASGVVPVGDVALLLAASPNSAFCGLVLEVAVGVVGGTSVSAGSSPVNALALSVWWLLGLGIAVWRAWSPVESGGTVTQRTSSTTTER